MTSSRPFLSFCIPTYNRKDSVFRLVQSILQLTQPDIEVVVLDNGSPDGTYDHLLGVTDPRLKLHRNDRNLGALYNMVHSLALGRGHYVIYSTDQDFFLNDGFDQFYQVLKQSNDVACGHCLLPGDPPHQNQFFDSGLQAMLATAYRGRHPTGYFFRRDDLTAIDFPDRFADRELVDLFPLEFVFAHLSLRGRALVYKHGLFRPETSLNVTKHLSSTTVGHSDSAFFSPTSRLRMALRYAQHLDRLDMDPKHKLRVEAALFLSGLWAATWGYRAVMHDPRLCVHYKMKSEHISLRRLLKQSTLYVREYLQTRKRDHPVHALYTLRLFSWAGFFLTRKFVQRVFT